MAYRLVSDDVLAAGIALTTPAVPSSFQTLYVPQIESAIELYLHRKLTYADGVVEWFGPSDDSCLLLSRTPVESVSEVRYDPAGGFGQIPDTFGDDTVLTAGEDYYLDLDGKGDYEGMSASGKLWRRNRTWGFRRAYQAGLLAPARVPARGIVKVTYAGGYRDGAMPGLIQAAVVKSLVVLWLSVPYLGPIQSEMIGGYNYSRALGVDLSGHLFAEVRQMLAPFKRYRVAAGAAEG